VWALALHKGSRGLLMKRKNARIGYGASVIAAAHRVQHEAEGGALGAIGGAAAGAGAGLPGVLAGAIVGGLAGAMAGGVIDSEDTRRVVRDEELDAAIGVSGGDIGEPSLRHPPERNRG
jgi:phage tail tape-measure protein